jgi:hypothetical protein
VEVQENADKRPGCEAGLVVEQRILEHSQLKGVFPQVNALLVAQAIGVSCSSIHETEYRILYLKKKKRENQKSILLFRDMHLGAVDLHKFFSSFVCSYFVSRAENPFAYQ